MILSRPWCHDTHTAGKESVWKPFRTSPLPGNQILATCYLEDILHSLYRLLLHVGEDVRVGVEGLRGVRERRIHRAVVSPSRQVTRVPL